MENCNSDFTNFIKNISLKINPLFNYFNLSQYDIITFGLLCIGIGLYLLINKDFYGFLFYLLIGHLCNILNVQYVKQFKNKKTKYGIIYDNFINWFKLLLVIQIFMKLYEKKINLPIIIIVSILLLLCNIHYSIKNCLKEKSKIPIDYYTSLWIKPICKINKEKLLKYSNLTKYFDENLTFIYLILIMIIIHNL